MDCIADRISRVILAASPLALAFMQYFDQALAWDTRAEGWRLPDISD